MAKPMREWIEHPDNEAMFQGIEDEITLMQSRGEFNDPSGNLNPDKFESERNQRKLSLTEMLIQDAPEEYLSEWEIENRNSQYESDTAGGGQ